MSEKNSLENELNNKLSSIKKNYDRQMEDIQSKMSTAEDQKKEI